ncbi:hypothetical protein KX928_19385 [Roseobacter sp. YSTF-M11]|uniref:Uncharacterized protein n=1 Tax=Roseobacter insulae TaxID=2859783 RepID=A0A9X1FYZ3_9RHOB|nr:hypothetical protein [Roseobacter insulae]MBW4709952.1 hypothetical protein [Roseobacter insulae]
MTIRGLLMAIPALFAGWLSVLVVVGLFTDAAPASVVVFPTDDLLQNLPPDVGIIGRSIISITLVSEQAGFARALYNSGALLVLPAGLPGCLPLPAAPDIPS